MNSRKYIRSIMTLDRTPQDKGWVTKIEISCYDKGGILNINGTPIGEKFNEAHRWLAIIRIATQIIEEFEVQCSRAQRDDKAA